MKIRYKIGLLLLTVTLLAGLSWPHWSLFAQGGQELLQNNNMEQYYGTGGANVVPIGWTLNTSVPTASAKQQWQFENQQWGGSWHLSTQSAAFTAVATQFVAGIRTGTPLRFSVYANIFTCNRATSCIDEGRSYRVSDTASGARIRIGIDPTGNRDAGASTIVWSSYGSPFDQFSQLVVETLSKNDNGVTLFIFYTQDKSMLLQDVYLDNASLLAVGAVSGTPGVSVPPTAPASVPFVTPQGIQSDGSIVHIVKAGDTLSSIAVAYKVTVQQIIELNNLPHTFIQPGQRLIIKPAPSGLPTGAVVITATPDANMTLVPSPRGPSIRPTFGPVLVNP